MLLIRFILYLVIVLIRSLYMHIDSFMLVYFELNSTVNGCNFSDH